MTPSPHPMMDGEARFVLGSDDAHDDEDHHGHDDDEDKEHGSVNPAFTPDIVGNGHPHNDVFSSVAGPGATVQPATKKSPQFDEIKVGFNFIKIFLTYGRRG